MWTAFRIKNEHYTSINRHYCVYYECDVDEANKIRKAHSLVFEQYELIGNVAPAIENIDGYRDVDNRFHQIYHKEMFYRLLTPANR